MSAFVVTGHFDSDNPIVYQSLTDLAKTWEVLHALEKQGIDIGNKKEEVRKLANKVREIGDSMHIREKIIKRPHLNATEVVIYFSEEYKGVQMLIIMGESAAMIGTSSIGSVEDGSPRNAILHAFWNAYAVWAIGDEEYVKNFTDAHEYGTLGIAGANHYDNAAMDLHNNAVGRELGSKYIGTTSSFPSGSKLFLLLELLELTDKLVSTK